MESSDEMSVRLLHVFDEGEHQSTIDNLAIDGDPSLDELAARKSAVSAAKALLQEADFTTDIEGVKSDKPGKAILSTAEEHDVDRLYVYSRKRSPVGKAVFGSSNQYLLFNADVPIVVLPADAAAEYAPNRESLPEIEK
ncbi:universal stress protein uspa-like protein [Haloferax denitrificans ATCC 35960]|uniref:Universal stress protein uspa-like protein n=2 Tax=Haloferax denitrificans TaxID=35745 RepID=M0JEX6_9EURY|nr:universal stress protein uspa-like protein [Haloferax denitrificans ATCC 35960]